MQQTMEAMRYRSDCSDRTDYVPSVAVVMGEVIDLGNQIGICTSPQGIAANAMGSLEKCGAFRIIKDGTTGPVFAKGAPVWFDKTANLAVAVPSNPTTCYAGLADEAAGTNDDGVKTDINKPPMGELADALTTTTTTTTTT